MKQLENLVDIKFDLLFDADLEPINVFIIKIAQLKNGEYKPSKKAITSCDDFFDFNKVISRTKRIVMLYSLLDIKVTSRRFETFDAELCNDEIVELLETLFSYIDLKD